MAWLAPRGVDTEDRLTGVEARRVLRRAVAMLRPYRLEASTAVAVLVASTLATLSGPSILRYGIDNGLVHRHAAAINRAALFYLGVAVAALILSRIQVLLVSRVGEKFLRDLRIRVFDHIQSMSMEFFDREPTGRLVARMTSDIDSLQELIQLGLILFIQNALTLGLLIVILVVLSPTLSAVCLVTLPIVVVASVRFRRNSNRAYLNVRDRVSQTLSTLQEGLSGVRIIQAFAQEDVHLSRFSRRNRSQLDANMEAVRISCRYFPVVEFAGAATTAAVIATGGVLVHRHTVTVGTVSAFVLYLIYLFDPIQQLSQLFNTVQSAGAALAKLFGLLNERAALTERPGAVDLPARGRLEVRGVTFSYGGYAPGGTPAVLRQVSLTVEPGERLALVGPTGAGKSTLAKLMARLYDPTEGSINFAGVDLRDATMRSRRQRLVIVPQEGYLFRGTVADNVRLGRQGASGAEVRRALDRIGVLGRFEALPKGLETEVRERGSRLSAGERQLVSLARAALADAEVLVLDEATSNLDPGTEAEVETAVTRLMEGRTVVVIAHRLSTAERSDRVAVIDDGGLAELGTHDELLAAGGRYAALFASWMGGQGGTDAAPQSEARVLP